MKGPKGTLSQKVNKDIKVSQENGEILVTPPPPIPSPTSPCTASTARLIHNMVVGVTKGFEKVLVMEGVGYRAQVAGKQLTLNVGYSHPVTFGRAGDHFL